MLWIQVRLLNRDTDHTAIPPTSHEQVLGVLQLKGCFSINNLLNNGQQSTAAKCEVVVVGKIVLKRYNRKLLNLITIP